ncbi:hypothetical protein QBC40DRAFT_75848 [Triangularia verruculosa]|uniref:Uncharacterized protein n=1 Tax=Triangularia verruculosa TaxID=2587418 RepID=A0AAN6XG74_9PEZI|nr:hypothetical protein QBC40DRAFT_75848 [Triangularia verruculosa]
MVKGRLRSDWIFGYKEGLSVVTQKSKHLQQDLQHHLVSYHISTLPSTRPPTFQSSDTMAPLPPAEKLSLAVRKNVRDEWDNNKADLEKQLSEILGTDWTVEADPKAIWPYHNDGYAKESLGSCIKAYVEGAIYQINYLSGRYGSEFAAEINDLAHSHVLTVEVEDQEPARFTYNGCDIKDGKLRILFNHQYLGTNISDALQENNLLPALNAAPSDKPLSFHARNGIRSDYEPAIAGVKQDIANLLGKNVDEITINPNFEANFAKLSSSKPSLQDWQERLGNFTLKYFEGLAYQMKYQKVGEDEMVQEGLLEAVSKNEYALRIVDSLAYASYGEVVVEDGVLYIQAKPDTFGTNIDYAAEKLVDQL